MGQSLGSLLDNMSDRLDAEMEGRGNLVARSPRYDRIRAAKQAEKPTMWTTKDNVTLPIASMDDTHVANTIALLRRGALQLEGSIRATGNRIAEHPADALREVENLVVLGAQLGEKLHFIETFLDETQRRQETKTARGTDSARYENLMGRTVSSATAATPAQPSAAPAEDEYDPFAETEEQRLAWEQSEGNRS
ncbi:hypothetical protein EON79_10250 [bacterium]|nr:MAG: hypothetical protein EON79_10250 [bacterium]